MKQIEWAGTDRRDRHRYDLEQLLPVRCRGPKPTLFHSTSRSMGAISSSFTLDFCGHFESMAPCFTFLDNVISSAPHCCSPFRSCAHFSHGHSSFFGLILQASMLTGRARKRTAGVEVDGGGPSRERILTRSAKRQRAVRIVESDEEDEAGAASSDPQPSQPSLHLPSKFHGCFSSKAVSELFCEFDAQKIESLRQIGLGGLTCLKSGMTYNQKLIHWLLATMDVDRLRIRIGDGSFVDLTEPSVESVIGVCSKGEVLRGSDEELSEETLAELRRWLEVEDGVPTLDDAKQVVLKSWPEVVSEEEEQRFAVGMAALCCGYMFGPRDRFATIPRDTMHLICKPEYVRNCNWASYILNVISGAARKVQAAMNKGPSSVLLGGC